MVLCQQRRNHSTSSHLTLKSIFANITAREFCPKEVTAGSPRQIRRGLKLMFNVCLGSDIQDLLRYTESVKELCLLFAHVFDFVD